MSDEVLKAVVDRVAYLESRVDQLREAISAWPDQRHQPSLTGWDGCPFVVGHGHPCTCGAEQANTARAQARKLAGLE